MKTFRKLALLSSLYLAQGLPYGFFGIALPALMRKQGRDLSQIGLTSLLALPWALKFLWAPYVDRFGSERIGRRKSWILPLQVLSALLALGLAFVDPSRGLPPLMIGLFLSNLTSATQDIATDGLAVDILSPAERGHGNGVQVAAYRVGMILGGGALLWLFDKQGWLLTFTAMSALLLLSTVPVLLYRELPAKAPGDSGGRDGLSEREGRRDQSTLSVQGNGTPLSGELGVGPQHPPIEPLLSTAGVQSSPELSVYSPPRADVAASPAPSAPAGASWIAVFRRPKMAAWLVVLFLYKAGESLSYGMVKPMLVDRGLSLSDIGWIVGTVGFVAGLLGAMLGGALVGWAGRGRALAIAGGLQIMGILSCLVPALGEASLSVIAVVSAVEHLTSGVATVTLFTVMMDVCGEEAAATEYTVQASVVVIATGVAATMSGFLARSVGYPAHFVVSAILSAIGLLYTMWAWSTGMIPPLAARAAPEKGSRRELG